MSDYYIIRRCRRRPENLQATVVDALLTEAGEEIITEGGDNIVHEDTET